MEQIVTTNTENQSNVPVETKIEIATAIAPSMMISSEHSVKYQPTKTAFDYYAMAVKHQYDKY